MHLRKYLVITLALFCFNAMAQEQSFMQLGKQTSTFNTDNAVKSVFDVEYADWYFLNKNPAFQHYFTKEKDNSYDFKNLEDKNIVIAGYSNTLTSGESIFYQGDKHQKSSILASGRIGHQKQGTLYGTASYVNHKKRNTLLNYAVNPQHYYPYLVGDTLGRGDQKYEQYALEGGYGINHKNTYYGIGFSYQGIAMSKLTDPRLSVYDSWFKVELGLAKTFKNHLIAFKPYFEINKQTISASSTLYRAVSVLQFNGFGAWKNTEVKATQGYERLLNVYGFGGEFIYKKLKQESDDFGYTIGLTYSQRKMDTEDNSQLGFESNSKLNLFTLKTQSFSPIISVSKKFSNLQTTFLITGLNQIRKGQEHVYKSQKVTENQNLYNYVKVASNNFYTQYDFENTASLKMSLQVKAHQVYHILTGLGYSYHKQEYVYPYKQIKNQGVSPFLGMGYEALYNTSSMAISVVYTNKKAIDNSYNTQTSLNKISTEQSYIPFLIRGQNSSKIETQLNYLYSLDKSQSIGMQIGLTYLLGNRSLDTKGLDTYELSKDRSETFFDFKIFYMF